MLVLGEAGKVVDGEHDIDHVFKFGRRFLHFYLLRRVVEVFQGHFLQLLLWTGQIDGSVLEFFLFSFPSLKPFVACVVHGVERIGEDCFAIAFIIFFVLPLLSDLGSLRLFLFKLITNSCELLLVEQVVPLQLQVGLGQIQRVRVVVFPHGLDQFVWVACASGAESAQVHKDHSLHGLPVSLLNHDLVAVASKLYVDKLHAPECLYLALQWVSHVFLTQQLIPVAPPKYPQYWLLQKGVPVVLE